MRAFVDLPSGIAVPIGSAGLLIGRHHACDLQVADETASRRHALLRIAPEGVELIVLGRQPVEVDGRPCTGTEVVQAGARLTFPGFEGTLRVEAAEQVVPAETAPLGGLQGRLAAAIEKVAQRASGVLFEPLPRGGRVTFEFPDGARRVYLPGRRYQLISVLAETRGEFVPDSELVARVWADDDSLAGRGDVNVLITRCRQDLVSADIDPASVLERAPGGRATRLL